MTHILHWRPRVVLVLDIRTHVSAELAYSNFLRLAQVTNETYIIRPKHIFSENLASFAARSTMKVQLSKRSSAIDHTKDSSAGTFVKKLFNMVTNEPDDVIRWIKGTLYEFMHEMTIKILTMTLV